jgi:Xaa-Pro aminopeptidase
MRYEPLDPKLFIENRARLASLLPAKSIAIINANDVLPTNADGTLALRQNADLFYLTGVEQEETMLLLFPDADDEKQREILFLREPNELNELWEGHKLRREEAQKLTGHQASAMGQDFWTTFHRLVVEAEHVYLNTNEHKRASCEVQTRDDRFVIEAKRRYPLHDYCRLAPLLHQARIAKNSREVAVIDRACQLTVAPSNACSSWSSRASTNLMWKLSSPTNSSGAAGASRTNRSSVPARMPASSITSKTVRR